MIEKNIDQEKIIKTIPGLWENWKLGRAEKESKWDECVKNYMAYIDESKYDSWPWRCKISRPISQEITDTVSASVKTALFPDNEDFFTVEGLDEIGQEFQKDVENYLKIVLFKMRYISSLEPFIKQLCIIGNSYAGLPWRQESVKRRRWQDGVVMPYNQITWDSTKIESHDMFDVVFDQRSVEYSQELTRIRRKIVSIDDLKLRKDIYSNLGSEKLKSGYQPSEQSDSTRQARRSIYGINEGIADKTKDVELLIVNGDINIDGKIYQDYQCVIANRSVVLQFFENPYWCGNPSIFCNYSLMHNELLGRGPLEPIIGLQKLTDTFSCQKADIANLIIGGFWVYEDDGVIDPENVIAKPFGMFEAANVDNIKSLVPSANPTLAFNEIEDLRLEAERSSGASKFAQGIVAPGRRTATEALQIGAGTNNRFNDIVTHIGETCIEPSLNMILQQQFQFNYMNPSLPPMAWEGTYKVNFYGARVSAVRELAVQMFSQFTQIIGSSPIFSQFINPGEFIQEWQKLLGIKNKKLTRKQPISKEFPELAAKGTNGANQDGMPSENAGSLY